VWVKKTTEEVAAYLEKERKDARFYALLLAAFVWVLVTAALSGGWIFSLRAGFMVQRSASGSFWTRLPIMAVVALPFSIWLYRRDRRAQLEKSASTTVCTTCDSISEGNAGSVCACGGPFVLRSTVKWVDDEAEQDVSEEIGTEDGELNSTTNGHE